MPWLRACDCYHFPCEHNPGPDQKEIDELNSKMDSWFKTVFKALVLRLKAKYGTRE